MLHESQRIGGVTGRSGCRSQLLGRRRSLLASSHKALMALGRSVLIRRPYLPRLLDLDLIAPPLIPVAQLQPRIDLRQRPLGASPPSWLVQVRLTLQAAYLAAKLLNVLRQSDDLERQRVLIHRLDISDGGQRPLACVGYCRVVRR